MVRASGRRPPGALSVADRAQLARPRAGARSADPVRKYVGRDRLPGVLARLKARGGTVVLANGCFDLLHVGHLRYLAGAKRAGGRRGVLVVALNTDASVRRLKGPGRPLMPLAERVELVSALECVDFVTSFGEAGAGRLIRELRPDIQAKGTDYTPESVPEAEVVRQLGGRVVITGDPKGHSTTALAERLRRSSR